MIKGDVRFTPESKSSPPRIIPKGTFHVLESEPHRMPACELGIASASIVKAVAGIFRFLGHGDYERAGGGVGYVVVTAWRMINAVFATARRVPLKPNELIHKPVMVEQIAHAAIYDRQEIEKKLALHLFSASHSR